MNFTVEGLVGYTQDYAARSEQWSTSDINWEVDYVQSAKCRECKADCTKLLQNAGVVTEYFADPQPLSQGKLKK